MFKNKLKKIIGNDENQGNNKRKIDYVDFSDFIKNIETIKKYN